MENATIIIHLKPVESGGTTTYQLYAISAGETVIYQETNNITFSEAEVNITLEAESLE